MIDIIIFSWILASIIGVYIAYQKIKNQNKEDKK